MKAFEIPEVEVKKFDVEDILTASTASSLPAGGNGNDDDEDFTGTGMMDLLCV